MEPSVGARNPSWIKCLTIDNGEHTLAFVTFDAIGADGNVGTRSFEIAQDLGYPLKREQVIFGASHTHSGPGGRLSSKLSDIPRILVGSSPGHGPHHSRAPS